jgi:hypothetical protein
MISSGPPRSKTVPCPGIENLNDLVKLPGRFVVVRGSSSGVPAALRTWVGEHLTIRAR